MKRAIVVVCLAVAFFVSVAAAKETWQPAQVVRAGFSGKKLYLHLGAGEATVVAKPDTSEIVVRPEIRSGQDAKAVKVKIDNKNDAAHVYVHGPKSKFRYTVEIPASVDLQLRMSAGDLNVSGVQGPVDAELHAGDFTLQLGVPADEYGPVNLSVGAGELAAPAFNAEKGGLWRHFNLKRTAKYKLHARTGAGDLVVK